MGLKLAAIFSDNMILQRNSEFVVWGEGEENDFIEGKICGQSVQATVKGKRFRLTFKPLSEGGPFELSVSSKNEEIVIRNVLIGEVWVAGGQSNMEFNLKDSKTAKEDIMASDYPQIRYYNVPDVTYEAGDLVLPEGIKDEGWSLSSPETSKNYSAVAYHFAKNLYEDLKVPIGIINCNKGGTSASSWMNEKFLAEDEDLSEAYLAEYKNFIENLSEEEEDRVTAEFYKSQEEYEIKKQEYTRKHPEKSMRELHEEIGHVPWPPPMGRKSYQRPAGLYSTKLKKVTPFTVKGVIWYQGEEDSAKPTLYKKLFPRLIESWREEFENPKLPFVFVQLPMFNDEKLDTWQVVRDAQLYTYKNVNNTYMVVTVDCGEAEDVHPQDKKPVGERLALAARQHIYNEEIDGTSPIYKCYKILDNKVEIYFDYVANNELSIKGSSELKGFEICGEDKVFYPAEAEVVGDKVVVYNKDTDRPLAVRYGWKNYIELNLYGTNGLPVSPFNTLSEY